ncbi:hypothetical protein JCM1841_006260 [Sporobolomyces salmonicolor]
MSLGSSLHAPSSAQSSRSSSSATAANGQPTVESELKRLTDKRAAVQAQLDVYFDVLKANHCTMETPLVDPQGFPRSDIDVAGVRTARMWIHRLRNDLKAVLGEMEQVVHRGLPSGEGEEVSAAMEVEEASSNEAVGGEDRPFAKVDAVAPGSPAAAAGLQRDDLLLHLSTINSSNRDNLRAVAALIGRSEGVELPLTVLRGGLNVTLKLTPRAGWGGRGLLGCHIVPFSS